MPNRYVGVGHVHRARRIDRPCPAVHASQQRRCDFHHNCPTLCRRPSGELCDLGPLRNRRFATTALQVLPLIPVSDSKFLTQQVLGALIVLVLGLAAAVLWAAKRQPTPTGQQLTPTGQQLISIGQQLTLDRPTARRSTGQQLTPTGQQLTPTSQQLYADIPVPSLALGRRRPSGLDQPHDRVAVDDAWSRTSSSYAVLSPSRRVTSPTCSRGCSGRTRCVPRLSRLAVRGLGGSRAPSLALASAATPFKSRLRISRRPGTCSSTMKKRRSRRQPVHALQPPGNHHRASRVHLAAGRRGARCARRRRRPHRRVSCHLSRQQGSHRGPAGVSLVSPGKVRVGQLIAIYGDNLVPPVPAGSTEKPSITIGGFPVEPDAVTQRLTVSFSASYPPRPGTDTAPLNRKSSSRRQRARPL